MKRKRVFTQEEKDLVARKVKEYLRHVEDKEQEMIWELSMRLEVDEEVAKRMWANQMPWGDGL